jgi:hypothetical protein
LAVDPVWELSGRLGLSVPGTVVDVFPSCGDVDAEVQWFCLAAEELQLLQLNEPTPTASLSGGPNLAYHASVQIVALDGEPGSQQVTGSWQGGPVALVLPLCAAPDFASTECRLLGRRIGLYGGVPVYAARVEATGPPPAPTCVGADYPGTPLTLTVTGSGSPDGAYPVSGTVGVFHWSYGGPVGDAAFADWDLDCREIPGETWRLELAVGSSVVVGFAASWTALPFSITFLGVDLSSAGGTAPATVVVTP